jgi:hypothetical protein
LAVPPAREAGDDDAASLPRVGSLLSTCSLGRLTLAPVGMEALALWEWLMLTIAPPRNAAMLSRQRCARGARGGGVRGCGTVGVSSSEGKFANLPATGLFCLSVRSERSAVHDNDYAPHGSNDTAADYALHCLLHPVFHMHSAMHDDSYRLAGLYIRVHLNMHRCTAGLCECRDPYCWMACYMYGSRTAIL